MELLNESTVAYLLAILCEDIFLHNPEKLALYVVGTSKLGFWNGHWHNNQQIKLCDPLKLYPCCKP